MWCVECVWFCKLNTVQFLQGMSTMPGMMPMVKRPAVADSKSGIPMYQPATNNTAAYQQAAIAMQLQQAAPNYVPVTREYSLNN